MPLILIKDRWKVFSLLVIMLLTFAGCTERGEGYKISQRKSTPYTDSVTVQNPLHKSYDVQEQQRKIEQQIGYKQYAVMVAIFIGVLAIMGLFFAWYAAHQWRKTQLKNQVLAQQMKDAIVYKSKYEELEKLLVDADVKTETHDVSVNDMSPEELFRYIEREVSRRLLFLNPSFDRQMIMDEFHISKERVGAAFSQGSKYDSLPQFVNDLRLDYASKLLVTTNLSITEIMTKAGFSNASVFSRYFSRKFQISPTQYRRANGEQS